MRTSAASIPADTIRRQREAAAPERSAWVSANAGSGKTHVLAQRVLRLLLAGVPPGRILCVTFTKAAAANMSNRIFRDLAAWTMLDDAALASRIEAMGAPRPSLLDLDGARRLFARTVETPGGLKVQTIHAFCERLLHLFPFEANVPARFEVLDDAQAADLMARAREAVLARAHAGHDAALTEALAELTREMASETFGKLLAEALRHRAAVAASFADPDLAATLATALGLARETSCATLEREITEDGIAPSEWSTIRRSLGTEGEAGKTAARLGLAEATGGSVRCDRYVDVFLTDGKLRHDRYLPKSLRVADPVLCAHLDAERDRVAGLVGLLKAARLAERTASLLRVAGAVLGEYEAGKRVRGLLDFEDLIERTHTLLRRSDAAWVLYKLDRGIDHVLVDEAQDTSPHQWEILQAITTDFFAGAGRPGGRRTVFAVGDEKQSIYSFQGARPAMFETMRQAFQRRALAGDAGFADVKLILSFRSARAVLEAVDRIFALPANAAGLSSSADPPERHETLRSVPGQVEIWPLVRAEPHEEPRDWRLPVDVSDPGDPAVVLANRVADAVARWTAPGSTETVVDGGGGRRPMRAGDVLILVRSRNSFFEAVIRALKARGVPVAGADRLALTEHIAVMDLVAAGNAALGPDDDFTLACVLKSPLIGLGDEDLIRLAPGRGGTLLAALEASDEPSHREATARLATWRRRAARLTPFGFYAELLSADGGRRALLGRLGHEAGDAIDEFLALALAHERAGTPSLLAFLARLDGQDISVKRDMEAPGDAVRVMTVHAAKGLEAKVVILPDTCTVPSGRHDPSLFRLGDEDDGPLIWSSAKDKDAGFVGAARAASRQSAIEEHNRLLYVALTRAEERLYVAGYCGEKDPPAGCWYAMIEAAGLDLAPAPAFWSADETVMRHSDPSSAGFAGTFSPPGGEKGTLDPSDTSLAPDSTLPAWLTQAPKLEPIAPEPPVRPSNPLGAADQFAPVEWRFGDRAHGRRAGLTAGRLTHKLLQHLPAVAPGRRREAADRFLAAEGLDLDAERRTALLDEVMAVIGSPACAPLFGPHSRAEVAVAATIETNGRRIEVTGQVDRIAVTEDTVFIADFKTGRPVDPPTLRHRLQLALYRAAVALLYPSHRIQAVLIWTAGPVFIELSDRDLHEALAALPG